MRVALHHQAHRFRPDRVAAELTPADEELLIGREAVDRLRGMLLLCFLKCEVRDLGAGEIADRLAEDEASLMMDAGLDEVVLELIGDARRALVEVLLVIRRPPVFQSSLGVELRALIIEAVTDLV